MKEEDELRDTMVYLINPFLLENKGSIVLNSLLGTLVYTAAMTTKPKDTILKAEKFLKDSIENGYLDKHIEYLKKHICEKVK